MESSPLDFLCDFLDFSLHAKKFHEKLCHQVARLQRKPIESRLQALLNLSLIRIKSMTVLRSNNLDEKLSSVSGLLFLAICLRISADFSIGFNWKSCVTRGLDLNPSTLGARAELHFN